MTEQERDRLLQQLVLTDNGGSSGPPGGAQRPVLADTGDLLRRIIETESRLFRARSARCAAECEEAGLEIELAYLKREYKASQTPVGEN